MRRKLYLYALLIAIPAVTLALNLVAARYMNNEFQKVVSDYGKSEKQYLTKTQLARFNLSSVCHSVNKEEFAEARQICTEYNAINGLALVSLLTIIVATLAFISISIIGLISRLGRSVLVILFRTGLYIYLLFGALLLVTEGVLAVGTLYYAVAVITERLLVGLIVVMVIAIGAGVLKILAPAINTIKRQKILAFGRRVSSDEHPSIWKFVDDAARKLGALKPDNIVVGLGEEYYVTESTVISLDGELHGRTMYLSMPLMRLLSRDELESIVGHELGHFRGKDTLYSRHFYPVYRGTGEALAGLSAGIEQSSNAGSVIYLPAFSLLIHFMDVFSKIESNFSRNRELEADKAGADLTSGEVFSKALTKIYAYSGVWSVVQQEIVSALSEGKHVINASEYCSLLLENADKKNLYEEIGVGHIPHPTDSHPPFDARLKVFGYEKGKFKSAIGEVPSDPAIGLIADYETLEKQLTDLEHVRLVQMGLAALPEEAAEHNPSDATNRKDSMLAEAQRINDYFANAVISWLFANDEEARTAALTAAKVAASAQRHSMIEYLQGMSEDISKEMGKEAGPIVAKYRNLSAEIATKEWDMNDIICAKEELARRDAEYAMALDKADPEIFVKRHPQVFKE